jgi:hypothetical protein
MNRWQRRFLGSTSLSYDLTDFELVPFFALTDHKREAVRGRYKPNHRIAAAIQIGFLKLAGRPIAAFKTVPARVLESVATQLGERAPTIASLRALYKRRATGFAHQAWAIDLLGLESFSQQHRAALKAFLDTEVCAAGSVKASIQVARECCWGAPCSSMECRRGISVRITNDLMLPEIEFRLIREFW